MAHANKPSKMSFSIAELSKSSRNMNSNQDDAVVYKFNPTAAGSSEYSPNKNAMLAIQITSTTLEANQNNYQGTQLKRKRPNYLDDSVNSGLNSPDSSSNDCSSSSLNSDDSEHNEQARKKSRTTFTNLQVLELEIYYSKNKYLLIEDRPVLAKKLKLGQHQIKWWFQNRRMKEKRQLKNLSGPFDMTQFVGVGKPCPRPSSTQPPHQPGNVHYQQHPAAYGPIPQNVYGYGHIIPVMYPGYTQQYYGRILPDYVHTL